MPARKKSTAGKDCTAQLGFEAKFWLAADKLRNKMDAAERSGATWTTIGSSEGWRGGANQFGVPPKGNGNFAWVQHFIHHPSPQGIAGFVLANGSMSSNQSGEGEIRKAIIEADLVDCMVALPGQLFYSTQIPVCLWFLARDKSGRGFQPQVSGSSRQDAAATFRDRRGEILFIAMRSESNPIYSPISLGEGLGVRVFGSKPKIEKPRSLSAASGRGRKFGVNAATVP